VLHAVQFVHEFWLAVVENFPFGHATQVRSVLAVPSADTRSPAWQSVKSVQAFALLTVEYFPSAQLLHSRSELLVPLAETY
jgi:hypothetical protein